ncbi:hypothetical protein VFPPC_16326 [Pochonia chlamydosporia 170]|uniref:Uncharacterized protein n=1 Tax=Pochonia chlamydosporia 170 TaxID=1380566 RepID=A0A179FJ01_METCM|nr:hypothetical protein VFPPC_16326 [Pochonia chlamydosporia 170]OAQ65278.2 hypothetical protein VFPPC_16326 [Pochonia chlamydosporia 170]
MTILIWPSFLGPHIHTALFSDLDVTLTRPTCPLTAPYQQHFDNSTPALEPAAWRRCRRPIITGCSGPYSQALFAPVPRTAVSDRQKKQAKDSFLSFVHIFEVAFGIITGSCGVALVRVLGRLKMTMIHLMTPFTQTPCNFRVGLVAKLSVECFVICWPQTGIGFAILLCLLARQKGSLSSMPSSHGAAYVFSKGKILVLFSQLRTSNSPISVLLITIGKQSLLMPFFRSTHVL